MIYNLTRFILAQNDSYDKALAEIKNGKKRSHWMWFIFPQIAGLGKSDTARFYAIKSKKEAEAYLHNEVLRKRLLAISKELLTINGKSATDIFGYPDNLKLWSSMTLFSIIENTDPVFQLILDKFFDGMNDENTLTILRETE